MSILQLSVAFLWLYCTVLSALFPMFTYSYPFIIYLLILYILLQTGTRPGRLTKYKPQRIHDPRPSRKRYDTRHTTPTCNRHSAVIQRAERPPERLPLRTAKVLRPFTLLYSVELAQDFQHRPFSHTPTKTKGQEEVSIGETNSEQTTEISTKETR